MKLKIILYFFIMAAIFISSQIFDNNGMKTVFGILLLIGIFIPIGYLVKSQNNLRKNLNEQEINKPEQAELTRIKRSKFFGTPEKNDKNRIKSVLILFIIAVILGIFSFTSYGKLSTDVILYSMLLIVSVIAIVTIITIIVKQNKITNYIKNYIKNKYGLFEVLPKRKNKIIRPEKGILGSILNNYQFSYKISKYNCILTNYYQHELTREAIRVNNRIRHHYVYKKIKNIFEYKYELTVTDIEGLSINILENDSIKKIIENFRKTKLITFTIKDNFLIITKETILYDNTKEDYKRDLDDIELFYNKIIKPIITK